MSIIFNYFNYYLYGIDNNSNNIEVNTISENEDFEKIEKVEDNILIQPKKHLITLNDLKSVNLTSVENVTPSPSRNAPPSFSKIDLRNLNKAQLNQILNVKLKPTPIIERPTFFPPRNPVIFELYNKFNMH